MDSKLLPIIIAILALLGLNFAPTQQPELTEFQSWKQKFGIKFDNLFEESYREKIFYDNLAEIKLHNAKEHTSYKKGINQFTAMTKDEFAQTYLGYVPGPENKAQILEDKEIVLGDIDWVSQGVVTPIKNQGQCGSCWAFSTTGNLEALSKIAYGSLQSFSEQQLVDCSAKYGNMGCNGGNMGAAMNFVRDNGIVHEDDYEYVAKKQVCKVSVGPFKISGHTPVISCPLLALALQNTPISVAVDATNWKDYSSGVFDNCQANLNHGVLVVGSRSSDNSWRIKNSWSTSWGEQGYISLKSGNTCGVCLQGNMAKK